MLESIVRRVWSAAMAAVFVRMLVMMVPLAWLGGKGTWRVSPVQMVRPDAC
jgi:hypothetical protein